VGCEEAEGFDILYDNVKPSVFGGSSSFKPGKPTVTCTGTGTQCNLSVDYILPPNYTGKERSGNMRFVCTADGQTICSEWFTLTQSSGGYSSDYSQDGAVTRMQTHSKGAGVPFVLMGDGFRDTDIASGKYDQALSDAFNYCFDIPPYNGLKEYFDVYKVTAVSPSAKDSDVGSGRNYERRRSACARIPLRINPRQKAPLRVGLLLFAIRITRLRQVRCA
jgi:hypothetical protein